MAFFNPNPQSIIFQLAIPLFLFSCSSSYADRNAFLGALCDPGPPAQNPSWAANLNSVFSSLETNVNLNNGFYKAEAGKSSDRAYGLMLCRGDVSPKDCVECSRESFRLARNCTGGKTTVVWQNWCFLRYSNESFYGEWEKMRVALSNDTLDDPRAAGKGMAMMERLAAAAPEETLMFGTSETEGGVGGKRYGLAQCSRDLKKSDCADCLHYLWENVESTSIDQKPAWQILSVGCFMWYSDSLFYFNNSTLPGLDRSQNTASRAWARGFTMGLTIFTSALVHL